ncbi:hypothetical protein [Candidatus Venteria ishoeyi]|uniref:Uncharacterized protein n=1 Tax=Candidatus Venteria ishoeyi TaxID=1899563 RepID=A0A1H6F8L2_9GAMM|nr:hypothetical protein [Candidatus Venteria ishoeyi]SEH05374.1 Uncharacterised protein [Candidatus Venteria ishoeyi]
MQVKIEILDTLNNDLIATEQFSATDSIVLNYNGGDDKLQHIVGSELLFSLLDETATDGRFLDLYTANEKQYKVILTNYVTSAIIWQGYLLPETYTEPYENGAFFVNFSAVCGLGLLKGKYFEDDFYNHEQDVITILTNIFAETDLGLNFYFTPGIENTTEKDFSKIYIDMKHYYDAEKQKYDSMYDVLDELMQSLVSVCFHQNNVWNVVGLNHRYLENYTVKEYTAAGALVGEKTVKRNIVVANALAAPVVSVDPPVKEVIASHEIEHFELPKTLIDEDDYGIVSLINTQKNMLAQSWQQHNNLKPYVLIETNEMYYNTNAAANTSINTSKYFDLRNKLYVRKGTKLKFELELQVNKMDSEEDLQTEIDKNLVAYELMLNGNTIVSNYIVGSSNGPFTATSDDTVAVVFNFIAAENGYLDIRFYEPVWEDDGVLGQIYILKKLELSSVEEQVDEDLVVNTVAENYSTELEYDVPISDDFTGLTKSFSLDKKRVVSTSYDTENITTDYSFTYNGKYYVVLQLYWLQIIDQNRTEVYNGANNIPVFDVVYNFNNGEQMVFETDSLIAANSALTVRVKPYLVPSGNYDKYETWSDSLYKLESNTFVQSVANVLERLYKVSALRVDATFQKGIDFNTLVNFNYLSGKIIPLAIAPGI